MKNFTLSLCITAMLAFLANTVSAQPGYYGPYFTHITSSANNDGGDGSILNNAAINGDSSKACIFTSVYGVYTTYNLGIYYFSSHWDIYREDIGTIPNSARFNVLSPTMHGTSFVHTADTGTIQTNYTVINNSAINNNPTALLFISHNYDPDYANYNYCDHTLGVWYDGANWTIYDDGGVNAFVPNTTFNVFAVESGTPNAYLHVADSTNTSTYITYLDNPFLNGNPNATIFVTFNLDASGKSVPYNHSPIGVWYDGSRWTIFNEITSDTIAYGSAFNVLIADNIPTGISEVAGDNNLTVYPNPGSSYSNLRYEIKEAALVEIKLLNMQGQEVASIYSGKENPGIYSAPIDLSSLAAGVYFCKFSVDGKVTTQSIVKQ